MDLVKAPVPIERLAARLRRLRAGLPELRLRLETASRDPGHLLSYDRLLHEAAAMLGVPAPPAPVVVHWDPDTRAQVEAALARAGLDVGGPAA
ncbi:MAG: hypothetical protein ACRD0H_02730 [Actinomycetes bacterium]